MKTKTNTATLTERTRITIYGLVQGVGFRPFIFRIARELGLTGFIQNTPQGVLIEAEGVPENLDRFLVKIQRERPAHSFIYSMESVRLDPVGYSEFKIRESIESGERLTVIMPDIAVCPECLAEIFDENNRRYLYPFTNCTNCGPRFSIVESMPYDRLNTTMKSFTMCDKCAKEYDNSLDRRFHAQPNACPDCGPQIELWNRKAEVIASGRDSISAMVKAVREGRIVALKGLGGFHLICDALNHKSVELLRDRKHRSEKPFALMFPSIDLVKEICEVSEAEERILCSPESPIVLLARRDENEGIFSNAIWEKDNPYLGVMLPYTPLHHILMKEIGSPIVATSGNVSEEPIVTDEDDAVQRLNNIADLFLVHNRVIARHVDDSIVRIIGGREVVLRRARGFAPLPIVLDSDMSPMVAFGAHLKNTIAFSQRNQVVISQHIGDLESIETVASYQKVLGDFQALYDIDPKLAVCDLHPAYRSSETAENSGYPTLKIQHHVAHVLSCAAENCLKAPFLGVSWDGTGLGTDNTIWGGEFFKFSSETFERFASIRTFRLPGSDAAIREPRRSSLGVLYEIFGQKLFGMKKLKFLKSFSDYELDNIGILLAKDIQSPVTSSAGRLFDAVSALLGFCYISNYEGQAAMKCEYAAYSQRKSGSYPIAVRGKVIDWESTFCAIIKDLDNGVLPGIISLKFHESLSEAIVKVAEIAREERVVLSGGCFQNRILTERTISLLREKGFRPYWHQRVPTNDGGIALGEIAAAASIWKKAL